MESKKVGLYEKAMQCHLFRTQKSRLERRNHEIYLIYNLDNKIPVINPWQFFAINKFITEFCIDIINSFIVTAKTPPSLHYSRVFLLL